MMKLLPLAIVPTLVWIAVWLYLWTMDRRIKKLESAAIPTATPEANKK